MKKDNYNTRLSTNRQRKRKRQNILLAVLVAILIVMVFVLFLNSKSNKVSESDQSKNLSEIVNGESESSNNDNDNEENDNGESNAEDNNTKKDIDEKKDNKTVKTSEIETEDENVEKAYIGDWKPIGTKQTGEHNTVFDEGSDDRLEIREALLQVTDIDESELIEYWIGNNGPDKVIATVADHPHENIFRVYLSWVDKEGWQVTKLEKLKEYNPNQSDSVEIDENEITKIEKDESSE